MPFVVDKALHCVDAGRRSVTVVVIRPPFVLSCGERQDPVVTADLCGVLPEWHWMQKRCARSGAPSHHELDTPTNEYASTICLCELEQSAKNPSPAFSKSSGPSHSYPRISLSTFFRIPAIACLLHLHTPTRRSTHIPSLRSQP